MTAVMRYFRILKCYLSGHPSEVSPEKVHPYLRQREGFLSLPQHKVYRCKSCGREFSQRNVYKVLGG